MHISVLQKELLDILNPQPNENFVDATIDGGGDSLAILRKTKPHGKILGIDWSPEIINQLERKVANTEFEKRLKLICDNFVHLNQIVARENFQDIAGIILDLGFSSWHLEKLQRGFSFQKDEILDMRYNPREPLKAKDIITDDTVEVINPDLHIATLTSKNAKLNIEMDVGRGRGFVAAEFNKKEDSPIGTIPIDSIFTPVKKVSFKVENTRVGNRTDYDRLIMEVWTNASIEPKEALIYAAKVFSKHLELFFSLGEIAEEEEVEELTPEEIALYEKLKLPISELELSVRSANCLREANIKILADLVEKTENQMLSYRNFGKKSLVEIVNLLKGMGLSLGMKIDRKRMQVV